MQKIEPGKIILGFSNEYAEDHYRDEIRKALGIDMLDSDFSFNHNTQRLIITVPIGKEEERAPICRSVAGIHFAGTIAVLVKVPNMGIW